MGVFRVKSRDLWAVKWREDGRQRVLYYKTEQEARAAEAERLAAQDTDPRPTVGELVVAFYRHNPRHERTKRNVVYFLAGYEKDGKHIEGPGEFLRDRYAETLTRRDLEMMRDNMRARNPRVTNATINKYQAYLKGIFSWAVEQELLPFHPWRFKLLKHIKTPVHVSVDSLTRIYQELPDYMQWAVKTALCLVLRPGLVELFGLRWEAFDWRLGIVYIQQGKTGQIKTVYPPAAYMQEALARFREDMRSGIPYVCHRRGQKVLSYKEVWKSACNRAGVSMRLYDIRHISITEMLAQGADLASVAAQAGHSSIETTAKNYAHVTPKGQRHAASLIPELPPSGK